MLNVRGQNVLLDRDVAMLYKCEIQELVKNFDRLRY
ncbi:MAG: ORF6N domain-containing protein [Paludibacteraceae bacterium]|nr:ORF6N domain-containing protein [Paludibacteraceae bacterium]